MKAPSRVDGSTLDAVRNLVLVRGNHLMGYVAIGLGGSVEDAVSDACDTNEDLACLVAALLDGLECSDGLRDAISKAVSDYFDTDEVA